MFPKDGVMTSSASFTFTAMGLVMLASFFAFLATASLYFARLWGYTIRIGRLYPGALGEVTCTSPKFAASIHKISITFHIPCSLAPYWAVFTVDGCHYQDSECSVILKTANAKLWFFPVLFRYTAGPWITTTLDGFSVRVFSSRITPTWVALLRNNIVYTVLDGDTIRLNSLKTKIFLNGFTGAQGGYDAEVEKPGLRNGEEHDEVRVRIAASQWHILNWRQRIYNFGELEAELRRSWVEGRGSLVLIAKEGRWIKLSAIPHNAHYMSASTLWRILHGIFYFPSDIFKICRDPLSTIDIHMPQCDLTFEDFQLRDAKLLNETATKLRREYQVINSRHPGILYDMAWELFVNGLQKALGD